MALTSKQISAWNRKVKSFESKGAYIGSSISKSEYNKLSRSAKAKFEKQVEMFKGKRFNESDFKKVDKLLLPKETAEKILNKRSQYEKENKMLSKLKLSRGSKTVGEYYNNVFSAIRINKPEDIEQALNQPSVLQEERKYKESYLNYIRDIRDKVAIKKFIPTYNKFIAWIEKKTPKQFMKIYMQERGLYYIESWLKYYEEEALEDSYGFIGVLVFEENNKKYMNEIMRKF